jgi:hypothetical protein
MLRCTNHVVSFLVAIDNQIKDQSHPSITRCRNNNNNNNDQVIVLRILNWEEAQPDESLVSTK